MNNVLNFCKRNFKEILRDPIIYIFCLGFPLVMLALFQIINKYSGGNIPMFKLESLLPAIIMFSYTFVMLTMALLVSKDRQTFFLKRLYSAPIKSSQFVLGYSIVGIVIGLMQTLICIVSALIISLASGVEFLSVGQVCLLIVSQLPVLVISVFLGVLLGTLFNDKSAPGICSVFISLAGMLGGCWMPLETMGNFEVFCKCLPFYPSVYIGRVITNATNALGETYTFNNVAVLCLIPIFVFMTLSVLFTFICFKQKMTSDK